MKPLVALIIGSVIGLASEASASFELVLAKSNGAINRYDPQSGAYLGSFGYGSPGLWSFGKLALDTANPGRVLHCSEDGNVYRYNYSTGIYEGSVALASFGGGGINEFKVLKNGNWLVNGFVSSGSTPFTRLYSPSGALIASQTFANTYSYFGSVEGPDNNIYTVTSNYNAGTGTYWVVQYNQALTYTGFSTVATGNYAYEYVRNIGISGSTLLLSGGYNNANWNILKGNIGLGQTFTSQSSNYAETGLYLTNMVSGHGGNVHFIFSSYASSTNNYANTWFTYNSASPTLVGNPNLPNSTYGLDNIAMVVAPEPGTWASMGIGACLLLRRRRPRS